MARNVANAAELIGLLEPRPGRVAFAIRLGLICALTALVTEIFQTPDAALTIYVAFFLNKLDRTTSLTLSIAFSLVITIIIGSAFLIARFVINDSLWRVASIAAISFGMLFLSSASKLKPIGSIVAMIASYALAELGLLPLGEAMTRALLYAWGFVVIPAAVSVVVNLPLARPPRRLAEQTIARRLRLATSMLRSPNSHTRARFYEALREGTAPIDEFLKMAGLEKTATPNDLAALSQAATSTFALSSAIDLMDRHSEAALPSQMREHIAQMLDEMADVFSAGGYPIEILWETPMEQSGLTLAAARVLAEIEDAIIHFTDIPGEKAASAGASEKHGFFAKDAFTNPAYVRYALKTTAAAMFCYVLYSMLDWPGIHTCFITCYLVSLDTAAESLEKLTLRILGCLVGAAAGYGAMLYLVPDLTSIGALTLVIFLGGFGAAYVAAGSPRISYAGFQIAFAFFLCVAQGPAPAFDLTIARDRVIGILIGNLVTYLVLTQFWPVSVTRRIDPAISALLRRFGTMARTVDRATRRTLASEGQSALGAVETDLRLARYEPERVRPSRSWILSREAAAQEIGALAEPLLLATDENAAAHLDQLADAIDAGDTVRRASPGGTDIRSGPLQAMIDGHFKDLERAITHVEWNERGGERYAPA